jgi:hypothetical protein
MNIPPIPRALLLVLMLYVPCTHSQYFGRNKVQYEQFDFKVLETEHFKIMYYPEATRPVTDGARMMERWYERFVKIFDRTLSADQPVIIYANHPDFQQTNVIGGLIPQGTGGVTEGLMNRIVLPLTGIYEENDHVLGHELTHAFHYELIKSSTAGLAASQQIPLWFIEGMSEYLTIGSQSPLTAMWMRDAVLHNDVPSLKKIGRNQKYFPYRYGHAL